MDKNNNENPMGKKKSKSLKKYSPKKVFKYIFKMMSPNSNLKTLNEYIGISNETPESESQQAEMQISTTNVSLSIVNDSDSVKDQTFIEDSLGIASAILSDNNNNSSDEQSAEPSEVAKWSNRSQSAHSPSLQTEQDTFEDSTDFLSTSMQPINDSDMREITGLLTSMVPLPPTPPSHFGSSRSAAHAYLNQDFLVETPQYPTAESSIVDANASSADEDTSGYSSAKSTIQKIKTDRLCVTSDATDASGGLLESSAPMSLLTSAESTVVEIELGISNSASGEIPSDTEPATEKKELHTLEAEEKCLIKPEKEVEKETAQKVVHRGCTSNRMIVAVILLTASVIMIGVVSWLLHCYSDSDCIYRVWKQTMKLIRREPASNAVTVVGEAPMLVAVYEEPLTAEMVATGTLDMIKKAQSVIQTALNNMDDVVLGCKRLACFTLKALGKEMKEVLHADTDYLVINAMTNASD